MLAEKRPLTLILHLADGQRVTLGPYPMSRAVLALEGERWKLLGYQGREVRSYEVVEG